MAGIAAGELDRRLTLQRPITTIDPALNQPVSAGWQTLATVWAKRTAVAGADAVEGAQPGRTSTHRFLIRWASALSGLTSSDQVACDGVTYQVDRIEEFGRRVGLFIWATARPDLAAP